MGCWKVRLDRLTGANPEAEGDIQTFPREAVQPRRLAALAAGGRRTDFSTWDSSQSRPLCSLHCPSGTGSEDANAVLITETFYFH